MNDTTIAIADKLSITKDRVKGWEACASGYKWFLEKFPQGAQFSDVYASLQADKRYGGSGWLIDKVFAELDATSQVQQTVLIAGADKQKIEKAVAEGANAATTGYGANAATTGEGAIAASLGIYSKAKAATGGAIVVCHRLNTGELKAVRAAMVGQDGVKPDAWYSLNEAGEFIETTE